MMILSAVIGNKFAGTFGLASFSSMQGDKAISAGEEGFVLTDSKLIYQKKIQLHHTNRTINENNKSNGLLGKGENVDINDSGPSKREWNELMAAFDLKDKFI